jgi:thiol-disulfide isomerase/thioredoxin
MVKNVNAVLSQCNEVIKNEIQFRSVHLSIEAIDSIGCDKTLRDIHIARLLYRAIDGLRKPLPNSMMKLMEEEISLPIAKKTVLDLHEKYLAIQNRNVSYSSNLKSNDEVKDMSDGEKILRKLIEPYKGKIILLDIWGTWCGPCKAALSHSQEEYERLKPYDMVFLYLANRSNDESWKNVIKEYNVMGDNVVHYNLPAEQQSAVENFLKVNAFPTYKLIDIFGNILDVNADPRDLDRLERLVKMLKQ